MPDHLHALPPGHMLAEYRIDRVLGSGGFGITYYAWDTHLDKPVAIKEYLPNEFALRADASTVQPKSSGDHADYQWGLARFLDEARTLARFRHQHLNEVHRFFEGNGTAYMVLEYIDGETLSDALRRDARLAPERLRRLLDELLSGLDEVHRAGYVHRDVKPGNIMFRADGSAVLLDFGAARQAIGQRSKRVTSILTPGYAPIEQYAQTADMTGPWTDLYALGMVAYRCLSGMRESELPDAPTRALLQKSGKEDLRPAGDVGAGAYDDALLRAVDFAVRMDESERPQSVGEMREMLAGAPAVSIPSPPISAVRSHAQARSTGGGMNIGWKRTAPMLLAALAVGGGVLAGLPSALDWWDWRGTDCASESQLQSYLTKRPPGRGRYATDAKSCLVAIVAERKRVAAAKARAAAAAKARAEADEKARAEAEAKARAEAAAKARAEAAAEAAELRPDDLPEQEPDAALQASLEEQQAYDQAFALLKQGRYAEAIAQFRELEDDRSDRFHPSPQQAYEAPQQAYDQAFALLKQSRYAEAIEQFQELVDTWPSSQLADDAYFMQAKAHLFKRENLDALTAFETVVARYPNSDKTPEALLGMGDIHFDIGAYPRAAEIYREVLRRFPVHKVAVPAEIRLRHIRQNIE